MPPISVFIIAKDEEDRIKTAIENVKIFADEILVIDSGSTDNTVQIAENAGAKVIFNNWQGYGPQKVFGENICKNKWILNIDADEEVLPDLAREIKELFSKNNHDNLFGYKIKIVNKFFGEKAPKKLAYYYNQLRLYNKDFCGFKDSTVHDSVVIKNKNENKISHANASRALQKHCFWRFSSKDENKKIGQLKNIISHQSFRSYSHWLEKINSYSSMQAVNDFSSGKNPSILKIFITPIFAFFKAYLIRRYFIYGFNGIIYSYIFAFGRTIKLIKIRELFINRNH